MTGIYLTQEGKQGIEAKIAELELNEEIHVKNGFMMGANMNHGFVDALKLILLSATILPVEKSWESVSDYITSIEQSYYPNGVIIHSKQ